MKQDELNEILIKALASYDILGSGKSIAYIAKRLPTISYTRSITWCSPDNYALCLALLNDVGTPLTIDADNGILCAVVAGGALNMNPAVVIIRVEKEDIHLLAAAKEGLIKQHTAQRIVDALISAITS